ncbi:MULTISPECIES: sigma-54 interaction domain-containing protein [Desulfosediminicola]|uniref:sigma-54 interaction domain-containing protein n=1 Tax=Desulfosediminicola TaxID=2886823 RepID=UPI0010AC31E7|nr:sigma 54-interacting transcriptional regulator [Desulfosediminicola ganghwensis]
MLSSNDIKSISLSLDSSHNGIIVINRDGIILIYNKSAKRIFNDGEADFEGRKIKDIRPEAWDDLEAIFKTGQPQIGKKITLDRATIITNRTPIVVEDNVVGVITVFQDVSEHEAIISQLSNYQKLHKELEVIFESSYDGLFVSDGSANCLSVNRSYEEITGTRRENLIGKNTKSLVKDKIVDISVSLEVLKQKKQITLLQVINQKREVIVTGTPVWDDDENISKVVVNVRDITELSELKRQLAETRKKTDYYYHTLQEYQDTEHALQVMVANSMSMLKILRKSIKAAKFEVLVLLTGESGVGKSMLAKLIHKMSPRKDQPFVKINCGAIPPNLMESELFGYEKGAFTGASSTGKMGLIGAAHKGTVFLDEIAELPLEMQVKLLEVIEDKQFKPVGATRTTTVDVRIIAATNRNLFEQVQKGLFREDLYYRLNVVPIVIPPLRQRRDDVPALCENFLEKINRKMEGKKRFHPILIELLRQYDFPGNVRELFNIIERMTVFSEGELLTPDDLPSEIRKNSTIDSNEIVEISPLKQALTSYEKKLLKKVLKESASLQQAADMLQIHPTTLSRKLTKLNLEKP